MSKYKYYFRKPKSVIAVDIVKWLAVAGAVSVAATSPYFAINILKGFNKGKKYEKEKICGAFYRLKKQGCINIQQKNHQIHISLTAEGKKKAGRFQIDSLEIKKQKTSDGIFKICKEVGRKRFEALENEVFDKLPEELKPFINTKEFIEDKTIHTIHKPNRNAPCSCGSGKKYKKCCGL